MRTGELGGKSWWSPEIQSRATEPSSLVRIHSRLSLTSGRDRKNAVNMVSTWQLQPITGNGLYGRLSVLRAGRNVSSAPPVTSSEGWGWLLGIALVLTWIEVIGRIRRRCWRAGMEPIVAWTSLCGFLAEGQTLDSGAVVGVIQLLVFL